MKKIDYTRYRKLEDTETKLRLMVPNFNVVGNTNIVNTVKMYEVDMNKNLMHVLHTRMMGTNLTFDKLLEFAIGYANTRLIIGDHTVVLKNIKIESLYVHTFYAYINMS